MNISVNGPISIAHPNILKAVDLATRNLLLVKLLHAPQVASGEIKSDDWNREGDICKQITSANIEGLVQREIVQVDIQSPGGAGVSRGIWTGIKMPQFNASLVELPQLNEALLYAGFQELLQGLRGLHGLLLVHMDVKGDNVFVSASGSWTLGDFGSACAVNAHILSFTEVLQPYKLWARKTTGVIFPFQV